KAQAIACSSIYPILPSLIRAFHASALISSWHPGKARAAASVGRTFGACPMRYWNENDNQTAESPVNNSYLAAQNPWLQQQFSTPLELGDRPLVVGRRPAAAEELPPWQPDLELNDTAPFSLSRNHFTIEKGEGGCRIRDLCSTLGTIVNGEPIGHHLRAVGPRHGDTRQVRHHCEPARTK